MYTALYLLHKKSLCTCNLLRTSLKGHTHAHTRGTSKVSREIAGYLGNIGERETLLYIFIPSEFFNVMHSKINLCKMA